MSPASIQSKFTRRLLTEWRRLGIPFDNATVVLAVSGGADSSALALAVADLSDRGKIKSSIVVAHFNHGFREDSANDATFVENLARSSGFAFYSGKARGSGTESTSNLEEKARVERYRFLWDTAVKHGSRWVLTGHTVNDQAETLLLNLIRGSGIQGLSGMEQQRPFGTLTSGESPDHESCQDNSETPVLYRPLLKWATREMTKKYSASCGVEPRIDAMNEDTAFQRVRIRKEVLPMIEDLNPRIVETLARTAENLAGEAAVLKAPARELKKALEVSEKQELPVRQLSELSDPLRTFAVTRWLERERGTLRRVEKSHLDAVAGLAASRRSGKTVELPGHGIVEKGNGLLAFKRKEVEK